MEKTMKNLQVQTKTNDVDEKGRVTVAVNRTGIEDAQGDISAPGSFDNTLKNDIGRMKWLKDHDVTKLLGVPLEGRQVGADVIMVGQLNMDKQECRDVYADYKLFAEYGRTLEHSVGVIPLKRDKKDARIVKEWQMLEYSTLSFLGANPCTFLVDLKSATRNQVRSAVEFLQSALKQPEYSDKRLKNIDMELSLLLKSLNGGNVVSCPSCGKALDYDELHKYKYSEVTIENAHKLVKSIQDGLKSAEYLSMTEEQRKEIAQILEGIKALKLSLTEKSVDLVSEFVVCPHCFSKAYKALLDLTKAKDEAEETDDEDEEEKHDKPDKEETDEDEDQEKKKSFWSGLDTIFL